MFFLVLLFLIFTSFFAAIRFPNLASRLRLPRFNFSKAFRNQKIKTLLNDRYFFNENILNISKGPLFIVLGKEADKLYESLLKTHHDGSKTHTHNETPWSLRGDSEAFALLTFSEVHYLFIHPILFNKKKNDEILNSRVQFLINRICKARRQNFIEGVILLTSAPQDAQTLKKHPEITNQINSYANIFEAFSKKLKIKLPLFLIEHEFDPIQKTRSNSAIDTDNTSCPQLMYKDENVCLGFFCDSTQKPVTQKYSEFIQEKFVNFSDKFNINTIKNIKQSDDFKHGIAAVHTMNYVKSVNASLIHDILKIFLKNFDREDDYAATSLTILNPVLFLGADNNEKLKNIFSYLTEHGLQKIEIPSHVLKQRKNRNTFFLVTTCFLFALFSFSILRSVNFLKIKRNEFNISVEHFKIFGDAIQSSLNTEDDSQSLPVLQETACQIIKSYSDIKNISFRYVFLFPSWNSKIATFLQQKYKEKFSLAFSNFLLQKYSANLNNVLESKNLSPDVTVDEAFDALRKYVHFISNYTDIYNQLMSNKSDQINKALIIISKNIYENKCVEDEQSYDFLTKTDTSKLNKLIKSPSLIQKNAADVLQEKANEYFSVILNKNAIMSAALNLNNDLKDFENLVELFQSNTIHQNEGDIESVKFALEKSLEDYQILIKQFPDEKPKSLSSSTSFFGSDFVLLIDEMKKNKLVDTKTIQNINLSAQKTFESFKKQIDTSTIAKEKNNFPILILDSNSELSINPEIINLFNGLKKINDIVAINAVKKSNVSDLHNIATSPLSNVSWVDRKLQTAIQKYTDMQVLYNSFNFDLYPENFSDYLQDYIFNNFEKYWSQALSSALIVSENTKLDNFKEVSSADQHGLVSSANSLKQVIEYLVAEHFDTVLSDFDEVYLKQIEDVFKEKTIFFDKKELFAENADFKFWDGTTSPAYDLFYASSEETLVAALDKQKEFLFEFYSQYIEKHMKAVLPVMQLRSNLKSFYYNRWYSIYLSLENKNKSYQNFSNFVLNDLKKFRINDCPNILEVSRDSKFESDYFDRRIEYLYEKLSDRCRSIYMNTALRSYDELVRLFNESLAGRYPFSRSQEKYDTQPSANPEDLEKFLEYFQKFSKDNLSFLLKYNVKFSERTDVTNFLSHMMKINSFFYGNSSEKSQDKIKTKLTGVFNFRSHKNEEFLANHIVDWELKIGDKNYGSIYGNLQTTQFTLQHGEPLVFNLNLSKDIQPKKINIANKNMLQIVREHSISYVFKDTWSLVRFINDYNTCSDQDDFCTKDKLKFEIPLEKSKNIVLFCDLNLLNVEGKKISLPTFPAYAPYFSEDNEKLRHRPSVSDLSNF